MRGRGGFSFLELMIVVALAVLILGFVVPPVQQSLAATRLHSSAVLLASELNLARTIAVTRGAALQVRINTAAGTFQVIDPQDPDHPPRSEKRLESGIRFAGGSNPVIEFFPRGFARGGVVRVVDDFGRTVEVQVLSTGMVEVRTVGGES
ncbi:MAG TPA: GspH/FimT family pseudopilin [Acidobacteriota bacterium]|jgi:type II secretory pathway pseudopilin PulG|nr:GspH/FimT family pseudopilin [Acidobacteriota bacterium]HRR26569.1 GspH/FimT family pseudopilin [Acidobacteriota bacterium]HRR55408.1 GspH/FimT family pseudopilin [Acidobacteriota bacterium]HRV06922.1 GspH/FimT family pseudopilin [Acidobacteriota bacterium]